MSGHVDLEKAQFLALRDSGHQGPLHLLNLIRLRERADYLDGREVSGIEAYQSYGRASEAVLARIGARIVWEGQFEMVLIGPQAEHWDLCFVAEYPSLQAFVELIRDPAYREAALHRKASAQDTRLIALQPRPGATRFGQFLEEARG
ncbi:DUF1330 domain-containing protein [Bosea psychrotolerans]|uniref:Uncharacterized protein (DUF1330 family) n=1 Tax=Bosea psychrotolerans TaxID=1871628 RepID=A0A2S4MD30_9HYPH|nr:DUF1330 domain-containing protein [Bosea psychrotolerans]POR52642.1 uncharacterized protein (DUF1330 family) [Bosea psychrotolerans]